VIEIKLRAFNVRVGSLIVVELRKEHVHLSYIGDEAKFTLSLTKEDFNRFVNFLKEIVEEGG